MQSKATTVRLYLDELPAERRAAIEAVRRVILDNLPEGYEEGMQYGMIGYFVPHRLFPAGYHCDPAQPLPFVCLASQKNNLSLYGLCLYVDPEQQAWFRAAWARSGKKLDMGASCVRFRKVEDVPLDVVAEAVRRMPVERFIACYQSVVDSAKARRRTRAKPAPRAKARAAAAKGAGRGPRKAAVKRRSS